eukprot:47711-Eustigmatos_ZCMA.PRE.1
MPADCDLYEFQSLLMQAATRALPERRPAWPLRNAWMADETVRLVLKHYRRALRRYAKHRDHESWVWYRQMQHLFQSERERAKVEVKASLLRKCVNGDISLHHA